MQRPRGHPGSQRAVTAGVTTGAVASAAVVAVALVRYPGLVTGSGTWLAVGLFVAVLLAYVVAATHLAASVVDRGLLPTAVLAGAAIAAAWLGVGLDASVLGSKTLSVVLLGVGPLVALAIGWLATTRSGSSRAGIGCVALAGLVAGLVLFLTWGGEAVATAGRPYDAGLLRDFGSSGASSLATYAVSDSLGTGMMLLLLIPLVSLGAGLLGASAAGAGRPVSR